MKLPAPPTVAELQSVLFLQFNPVVRLFGRDDKANELPYFPNEAIPWRLAFSLFLTDIIVYRVHLCDIPEAVQLVRRMGPLLYDMSCTWDMEAPAKQIAARLGINRQCAMWTGLDGQVYDYRVCNMIPINCPRDLELSVMTSIELNQLFAGLVRSILEQRGDEDG